MSAQHASGPIQITGPLNDPTCQGPLDCIDPNWRLSKVAKRHIVGGVDTPGGLLAFANPENGPVIITAINLNITTQSAAACAVSAGTAGNGTTSSANLLDTLSVAAAGVRNLVDDKGTNGKTRQLLPAGQFITFSTVTGASAGLVMDAYIEYVPA